MTRPQKKSPSSKSRGYDRSHYYRPHQSGRSPAQTRANFKRHAWNASFLVPGYGAVRAGWKLGSGIRRFHKAGGTYMTRKLAGKAWRGSRRVIHKVRHPLRNWNPIVRLDRRLPFYRARLARRAAIDLAKDAAYVGGGLYYAGGRIYDTYSRTLGARSESSPTRTALSQSEPIVIRGTSGPRERRRRRQKSSSCPPGHYYSYKHQRCMPSKFRR